jgi:hypothetical protein
VLTVGEWAIVLDALLAGLVAIAILRAAARRS